MDAGKKTINDIFNGNRLLEIPFFQRSYVWGEEQLERWLEDMASISQNAEPYFLGSIILKQQSTATNKEYGDVRTIIDGQQRLTTLALFFKVLSLKSGNNKLFDRTFRLNKNDAISINHNYNDRKAFNQIMDLTEPKVLDEEGTIFDAYRYFNKNIDISAINSGAILDNILFVGIDLNTDDDEQQIFDTINSLGVKLTTAELLKNHLFNDDIQLYEKYWKNIFECDNECRDYWDQEITTGRLKRTFIDLFFFSFLHIKIQDKKFGVKSDDKESFSRVDKLFDSYKRFIKNYWKTDLQSLLREIASYAQIFRNAFDYNVLKRELCSDAGLERINEIIFAMETTTLIPYILFIEYKYNKSKEDIKNELYGFIESFVLRRIVVRASNKNYNQLFTERLIGNEIVTKKSFMEFLQTQNDTVNYLPDDGEVAKFFGSVKLTNKQATGLLYMIESKIRNRKKHSTQLLGISGYTLEHIMPKKWENHWGKIKDFQKRDERNKIILTLGNLTIIPGALNTSIRDAAWQKKIEGNKGNDGLRQFSQGIDIISDYLDCAEWDESVIDARTKFLLKMASTIWAI